MRKQKREFGQAVAARAVLFEAAGLKIREKGKLESFLAKKSLEIRPFDVYPVFALFSKQIKEDRTVRKKRIEVLAVNYKQQTDIVERFNESNKVNYGILLDTEGMVTSEKYGIKGLPHLIGVDAKGTIVYRGTDLPVNKDEFIRILQGGL